MEIEFRIALFVAVAVLVYFGFLFNQAICLRNLVREAWSGIDVQLKKRHDLIPQIVESVKGYQRHEKSTLSGVTAIRNQGTSRPGREVQESEEALNQSFLGVFALIENYPNLKADKLFQSLVGSLTSVEEELEMARRYYSGAVRNYNVFLESFPQNFLLKIFSFQKAEYFEITSLLERLNPEVKL